MEKNGKTRESPSEDIANSLETDTVDAELAKAVDMSIENDIETEEAEAPAPAEPAAETDAEETPNGDGAPAEAPVAEMDDALVERAVRAGLSLAEAKAFGSRDALEGVLGKLEAKDPSRSAGQQPADPASDGEDEDDPFAGIDLDEIDENIVKAMKAMSAQNAAMRKEIETLKKAGESAKAQDRFSQLVGTLDESVQKGMDAATRSHLKKQFDILSAGYKAMNTEKKDADIFAEAAKLAIGDRMTESAERKKAEALAKRKNLALAKPGGEGAARRLSTISGDGGEYADIIAGLQEKGLV